MTKRSSSDYTITTSTKLDLEDLIRQLSAVSEFPAMIQIGNRVFPIANRDELWSLKTGVEVAWDLVLDKWEAGELKPVKVSSLVAQPSTSSPGVI